MLSYPWGPSLAMSLSRPLDHHYSHIFKTGPVPVAPLQHVPPARRTHPRLLQRQRSPAGFLRHRRQRRGYEGPEGPIRRKSAHSLSEEASAKSVCAWDRAGQVCGAKYIHSMVIVACRSQRASAAATRCTAARAHKKFISGAFERALR